MKILLTGCAGFIGSHTLDRLLAEGHHVIGVDNFDPFYSRSLKAANIERHLSGDLEGGKVGSEERSDDKTGRVADRTTCQSGFRGAERRQDRARSESERVNEPLDTADQRGDGSDLNTFPPSHSASTGSFEFLEADLAEPETYQKLKFLADSLPSSPPSEGGVDSRSEDGVVAPTSLPATGGSQDLTSDLRPLSSSNASFDAIIHLAAKAGVRPSIEDPVGYQRANVIATQNLLEFAKDHDIKQFVFASSSSVYGVNPNVPWSETHPVSGPISPYASTKVSCELLGHVYSHLYGIRFLGLRFFTVYGPRQRPDLAINKFVRLIEAGEPIPVFGDGSTRRDYTYVADIVEGILGALHYQASNYEIINLGNDQTVTLSEMIETIEEVVGKKAEINRLPEQPGDVPQTWADVSKAGELFGYEPKTSFRGGIERFVAWRNEQLSF